MCRLLLKSKADHQSIAKALKCDIYFAKPYHSWQRGLNENTNGLIRRFYPKGFSIGKLTEQEINNAQLLINLRPRKTLGYLSPIEVLFGKSAGQTHERFIANYTS